METPQCEDLPAQSLSKEKTFKVKSFSRQKLFRILHRSRQDLSVYKNMMEKIKRGEEARDNTTSPIFQLQVRYYVRSGN